MAEADEEALELRLLTDAAYGEEFDTVVDELTDEYVQKELSGAERERVEKYFLSTTERQQKLLFASELLRHAEAENKARKPVKPVPTPSPGLLAQIIAFFKQQSFARLATTAAALVIAVGLAYVAFQPRNPGSQNYAQVYLEASSSDRATGSAARKLVPMPDSGLSITFNIPAGHTHAESYNVKLVAFDEHRSEHDLAIEGKNEKNITVAVPAKLLSRGMTYVLQLESVKAGKKELASNGPQFTIQ